MAKFTNDMIIGFGNGEQWGRFIKDLIDDAVTMSASAHRRADTGVEDTANATTEATAFALATSLKAKYNAHIAKTSAHFVADASNDTKEADATTVATLVALANDLKAKFNLHLSNTGHVATDLVNGITSANAAGADDEAKVASACVLLNEAKVKYNAHIANAWKPIKTSY